MQINEQYLLIFLSFLFSPASVLCTQELAGLKTQTLSKKLLLELVYKFHCGECSQAFHIDIFNTGIDPSIQGFQKSIGLTFVTHSKPFCLCLQMVYL